MELLRSWGLEERALRRRDGRRVARARDPDAGRRRLRHAGRGRLPHPRAERRRQPDRAGVHPAGRARAGHGGAPRLAARGAARARRRGRSASTSRDDGVTVAVRDGSGIRTLRARYLVAADGIRSTVRAALGIPTHGPGHVGTSLGILFRAPAVGGRRRAPPRHLLRRRGRDEGRAPGRPARPLDGRPRRPASRQDVVDEVRRGRSACPDLEPRIENVARRRLRGRARRALPRAQRVPGRRRRAPPQPARRDGDEHRDPRRLRPGLEARLGAARLGGRGAARQLRGRAPAGRRAQRRPRGGPERLRPRRRRGAARRPRRPHHPHVAARRGRARVHARPGRRRAHALHRPGRGRVVDPAAAHPPVTVRRLDAITARALGHPRRTRRCWCAPTACPATL